MCIGNEYSKSVIFETNGKSAVDFPKELTIKLKKKETGKIFINCIRRFLLQTIATFATIQTWKYYRMLRGKTQPAHLLMVVSVILIGNILQLDGESDATYLSTGSSFMKLVYLGSFAAHFGAQIWMTFVSGLALYFNLPRHTFGSVQKILFPKYFSINSILSLITLFTFAKCQTSNECRVQMALLVLCFGVELLIRLYLAPILVELMVAKNAIELEADIGTEVGTYQPGSLVNRPEYVLVYSNFRKVHMVIAIGNMISMGCTVAHLYYLSSRICI